MAFLRQCRVAENASSKPSFAHIRRHISTFYRDEADDGSFGMARTHVGALSMPISTALTDQFPLDAWIPSTPVDSMELLAVPKRKVSKSKIRLRNIPKALKPAPVIVRCTACGKVKLPHYFCCRGDGFIKAKTDKDPS